MKKNNAAISSSNLTITMTTNTSGKDQRKKVSIFECSKKICFYRESQVYFKIT